MNPRATLLLFLVTLLVVGGLVYLRLNAPTTREAMEAERYAAVFDADRVDGLDLVRGSETISLRRVNGLWQMVAPVKDRADPVVVDRLTMAARFLEVRDRLAQPDQNVLAEAGLVSPRLRLDLRGDRHVRLDLGTPTAIPEQIFARVDGHDSLLRVPSTIVELATAPVANFRDPRLTDLAPGDIEKFTVRRADGEMTVRLERGQWMVDKPVSAPADPRAVAGFLELLLGLRVTGFNAADPEAAGILRGQIASISMTPRGGGQSIDLELLRRGEGAQESFLARFAPRGGMLEVDGAALALFEISPEALRDRSLGYVEPDAVDRINITMNGATKRLVRSGSGWIDETDGSTADTETIEAFMETFNTTSATGFRPGLSPSDAGLEPPEGRVEFLAWLSENTPEDAAGGHLIAGLDLGREDEEGNILARRLESSEILAVPGNFWQNLKSTAQAALPPSGN